MPDFHFCNKFDQFDQGLVTFSLNLFIELVIFFFFFGPYHVLKGISRPVMSFEGERKIHLARQIIERTPEKSSIRLDK